MNDQLARSLFMDYIYDEISEEEKEKLELYLEINPDLKKELNKLQNTRSLLQQMPEAAPTQKLLVMEPRSRTFSQWWQQAMSLLPQSLLGKTAIAAAAILTLVLITGSAAQLHIDTSGNGYAISLGYSPTVNQGLTPEQASTLVNQIREENATLLSDYAETISRQNEEQLQQIVNYFHQQRMNDLQLVDQTLDELHQNTNYHINRTNEYVDELLQTISYQNQNE